MKGENEKALYGVCVVGEKGQIVIPKKARDAFDIKPGDSLVMLGDVKKGIAIVKAEVFTSITTDILNNKKENDD